MKGLLITCVLLGTVRFAPAQGTISVPNRPDVENIHRDYSACSDVNIQLLAVIRKLTDQGSVENELKFEESNHLTFDQIYARRLSIINSGIDNLRAAKGSK